MPEGRVYVVGDRGAGVLIVQTSPLRVVEISHEEIIKYSEAQKVDGYAKLAAALWRLMSDSKTEGGSGKVDGSGIESLVTANVTISEASFVFSGKVGNATAHANIFQPNAIFAETSANITGQNAASVSTSANVEMSANIVGTSANIVDASANIVNLKANITHANITAPAAGSSSYGPASDAIDKLSASSGEGLLQAIIKDSDS